MDHEKLQRECIRETVSSPSFFSIISHSREIHHPLSSFILIILWERCRYVPSPLRILSSHKYTRSIQESISQDQSDWWLLSVFSFIHSQSCPFSFSLAIQVLLELLPVMFAPLSVSFNDFSAWGCFRLSTTQVTSIRCQMMREKREERMQVPPTHLSRQGLR